MFRGHAKTLSRKGTSANKLARKCDKSQREFSAETPRRRETGWQPGSCKRMSSRLWAVVEKAWGGARRPLTVSSWLPRLLIHLIEMPKQASRLDVRYIAQRVVWSNNGSGFQRFGIAHFLTLRVPAPPRDHFFCFQAILAGLSAERKKRQKVRSLCGNGA